jgi:hypothetical protein
MAYKYPIPVQPRERRQGVGTDNACGSSYCSGIPASVLTVIRWSQTVRTEMAEKTSATRICAIKEKAWCSTQIGTSIRKDCGAQRRAVIGGCTWQHRSKIRDTMSRDEPNLFLSPDPNTQPHGFLVTQKFGRPQSPTM